MRSRFFKVALIESGLAVSAVLFAGAASAQSTVSLTAAPQSGVMPDGTAVPMWGLSCGTNTALNATGTAVLSTTTTGTVASITLGSAGSGYTSAPTVTLSGGGGTGATATATLTNGAVSGFTITNAGAGYTSAPTVTIAGSSAAGAAPVASSCAALNPNAGTNWSPPVITVPTGNSLTINLTNNLTFQPPTPAGGTAPAANTIPTSLTIIGQIGGGLGSSDPSCVDAANVSHGAKCTPSPAHSTQSLVTWSTQSAASFTPPSQGPRVRSFATEVAATAGSNTAALTWNNLQPGTYLIESGTHPSIQGPMGLYGILVVTTAPSGSGTTATPGTAYGTAGAAGAISYSAEVPVLFSEIDPVQNNSVSAAVNTAGFSASTVWSGQYGGCGNPLTATGAANPAYNTCFPPAVNYTPIYYMINGVGFSRTNPTASLFAVTQGTATGTIATTGSTGAANTVLVRLVNAGLRMHVPSIVGSQTTAVTGSTSTTVGTTTTSTPTTATVNGFTLIAEDGNPVPGAPHVQSEVFMAAGKTFDVMINVPASGSLPLAIYDRELSLSGNQIDRDAGMLAYIGVNGAALPTTATSGAFSAAANAAKANNDLYNSVIAGQSLSVSDPGKGVIANDANVYGVAIVGGTPTTVLGASATRMTGTNGTLVLMANGTFTYTPTAAAGTAFAGDTFTYCANTWTVTTAGTTACSSGVTATITFGAGTLEAATAITAYARSYTANTATQLAIKPPGVLGAAGDTLGNPADTDGAGLALSVLVSSPPAPVSGVTCTAPTGGTTPTATVYLDANGGFTATSSGAGTCTFPYQAKNTQGTSSAAATVTVTFPGGSGLVVNVLDGSTKAVLPNGPNGVPDYRWIIEEDRTFYIDPNCAVNPPPAGCTTASSGVVPTLGVNFHTSYMPYIAQGCTGPLSCEGGQTVYVPPTYSSTGALLTPAAHVNAVCDVGNGVCRPDTTGTSTLGYGHGFTPTYPGSVPLDPSKRYYISILPGDAAGPFATGYGGAPDCATTSPSAATGVNYPNCGHGMGGAPIPALVSCTTSGTTITCTGTTSTGTAASCTIAGGAATGGTLATATSCLPTGITLAQVNVLVQPSPYPTGRLSVFVFEDDAPLNGEHDSTGGAGGVNTNLEPGLGQFQIHLWDAMGGNGDFTGQMTYDMFNQPLTNSLDGTIDPLSGKNACPITQIGINNPGTNATSGPAGTDPSTAAGITGMIVTCPEYEADGVTPSPLAGQAVVSNLMPGRWGVIATPGADRIARGEEWLQTNTLDGQKAHDSFVRIGEPSYFQEYGPASFHVSIGFANPAIINARKPAVCKGTDVTGLGPYQCNNTITGRIVGQRLSRTPDERLYGSGSHDAYAWTQCYVSVGDPDGEDFAFTKCAADGTFTLSGLPDGDWRLTTFDQWNDQLVDGLSTPVRLSAGATAKTTPLGDIAATQWQTNLYTRTFIDDNKTGVYAQGETGIPFANVAVRLRDGSLENLLTTDFTGTANFNETFPLFSWYVVETDVTRYKNTGTHAVYDVGGPADGTTQCGNTGAGAAYPPCGSSTIGKYLANTAETISVPTELRVPGALYCRDADCSTHPTGIQAGAGASDPPSACTTTPGTATTPPTTNCSTLLSSGRIDAPWVGSEGWQGFPGQSSFLEFGKTPYAAGENGGIEGHVVYASTRPFDDPMMLVQTQWTPLVPHVTINLYQEGVAADGVTPTLTLVDTTQTSSWDDWAQGFRVDANGNKIADTTGTWVPNMSCPGQASSTGVTPDLFFFSLYNQPQYLDLYNNQMHGTAGTSALPYNSQFKCYDGMHNWNQVQPAPYDGMYKFPSIVAKAGATGALPAAGTSYILQYDPKTYKTNCTICKPNTAVPATDPAYGTPMLPIGKYVVEVVLPAGYELVKEEDKNILIGDNFIAPVTQQFGGLGNVFIMPDQASVATYYTSPGIGYNANSNSSASFPGAIPGSGSANGVNLTTSLGTSPMEGIVPGFVPEPLWPCVGEARVVPDYISLYPWTKQVAPFAGATRPLCDRKEVTLTDQMHAIAKFWVYTSTHIASKFTGGITDDYTSEFDPFSPQFGEKFAPPDLPVSVKDWTGAEISRVYADHWGAYNGMTYSTWEVNPPNPTGYSPTMMVFCMNDPGPIVDKRPTVLSPTGTQITNPTFGQTITDPLFTPGYSQFCYELPFMPGTTQYLDTPVVPTSAFAGAGYNNVDCAYPDATPAVKEVDSQEDGIGPWVATAGHHLNIYALGDQMVPNNAYDGPSATTAPYNQKKIRRHYGFGSATGTVTIGGVTATVNSWSDTLINVTVPSGVPACAVQQQSIYGGSAAQCGELVITAAAVTSGTTTYPGRQSVDAVTVTIGGKAPTHVAASGTIQAAIDAASPGDLIMIDPLCNTIATGAVAACSNTALAGTSATQVASQAAHNEMVIMWKPVRLQGVGAPNSVIDGTTHPAGDKKLSAWRAQVDCLFGLALNGQPYGAGNAFDPSGKYTCVPGQWKYFTPTAINPQVDRLPLEAVLGWDTNLNGNLAELLQEPSLMGALEGAGITVLGKGVNFPSNPYDPTLLAGFPTGTTLLQNTVSSPNGATCLTGTVNPFPSNFSCNPSSIDAVTITQSSQGGGGIFLHGWNHNIRIANNRIYSNAGTLAGGINVGQGEFAPPYTQGGATNAAPGSCEESPVAGIVLPYCQNVNVDMHNNYVSLNSSTGDELFSATPAGPGGVSICTGADYYKFNYNWVCGNLSSGDGGGLGHIGFSYNGDIEHNTIIFNQSTNPTIPANGGGMVVMGAPDVDVTCPLGNGQANVLDLDCALGSQANILANAYTPSDGVGPGLVINANLIMGNTAESGTGGAIAFNAVNGSDMVAFPDDPGQWNSVTLTNNIIVNNVAGWDGAGLSLVDSPNVNIINNTIAYNDSTASAGVLFNTLGGPLASQTGPTCTANCGTASLPQVGGVVALQHSALLMANLAATPVVCPPGHYQGTGANAATNGACRSISYPKLENNIIYRNASYQIGVGSLSAQFQQNVITLYNAVFTGGLPTAVAPSQTTTGQCLAASYWDIGVRGDTGPNNHSSTFTLHPTDSVLSSGDTASYGGTPNSASGNTLTGNPLFFNFYCNGSRQPPEACPAGTTGCGWAVPPGISDATVPNPIFNLTPAATVDEGNNWVNLTYGPLTMSNPTAIVGPNGNYGGGLPLGNYAIQLGSAAQNLVTPGGPASTNRADAPAYDFFDTPRTGTTTDAGAVLVRQAAGGQFSLSPAVVDFGYVPHGSPTTVDQDIVVTNSDVAPLTINSIVLSCTGVTGCAAASFSIVSQADSCSVGGTLGAGQSCMITVAFIPSATQAVRNANLVVTTSAGTQTVSLTGHDAIAAAVASAITPALNPNPPNTAATTGTITVTNRATLCAAAGACLTTGIPAGYPASSVDAGPYIPTAITLTPLTGTGTFTLGGTCAVGTAINPGSAAIPANAANGTPASAYVPSGSCTVTVTYTPPPGATGAALNGTARLLVTGYGNASTTPIINNLVIPAN